MHITLPSNILTLHLTPSLLDRLPPPFSAQRNVQNYLVLSLALADFMVALIVMPLAAFYELKGQWTLGMRFFFSKINRFFSYISEHLASDQLEDH